MAREDIWLLLPSALTMLTFAMLGNPRLLLTAVTLDLDWLLCLTVSYETGTQFTWGWLALIDLLAAFALALRMRQMEAVLSMFYAGQVFCHMLFCVFRLMHGDSPIANYYYWWALFYSGLAQAAVFGVWSGWNGGRRVRQADRLLIRLGHRFAESHSHGVSRRREGR